MNLDELKEERQKQTTRIFWLGLEIALIFGIPAALGAVAALRFDNNYILIGTFIFSWIIMILRYRSISRKLKMLDEEIKKKNQQK